MASEATAVLKDPGSDEWFPTELVCHCMEPQPRHHCGVTHGVGPQLAPPPVVTSQRCWPRSMLLLSLGATISEGAGDTQEWLPASFLPVYQHHQIALAIDHLIDCALGPHVPLLPTDQVIGVERVCARLQAP